MEAHTGVSENTYDYFFDPAEMRYYLKEDYSDEGTASTIENGDDINGNIPEAWEKAV